MKNAMRHDALVKGALLAGGIAAAGWFARDALHAWWTQWGVTTEELFRSMPLDERIPNPRLHSTTAVSVAAPPEVVWASVVRFANLDGREYRNLSRLCALLGVSSPNVETPDASRALSFALPATTGWLKGTWVWAVLPSEGGASRLVSRVRADWRWLAILKKAPLRSWPTFVLIEPAALLLQRKMLLDIKKNAERRNRSLAHVS
jgi:hypothetical protein